LANPNGERGEQILFFPVQRQIMPRLREKGPIMPAKTIDQLRDQLSWTVIYGIGLVIALVIMAVLIHYLRAWYRDGDDPAAADDEIVQQMEDLRRRGDLTEEEFRSIKSQFLGHEDR
jgi:hypothetical protein